MRRNYDLNHKPLSTKIGNHIEASYGLILPSGMFRILI